MRSATALVATPDAEGVLQLANLSAAGGFRHGFETRVGCLADVAPPRIARMNQVHGAIVYVLPDAAAAQAPFFAARRDERPSGDALLTDRPGVTVAVAVADCLPILIADPHRGAVAAVHGGWRGIAAGVLEAAVAELGSSFGSRPADLIVGIGPAIGPCCFEVGEEVITGLAARGYGDVARVPSGSRPRPYCDLPAVARAIAVSCGVAPDNVADAALCTRCNSGWLWSYRRDGDAAGRMLCGIARA